MSKTKVFITGVLGMLGSCVERVLQPTYEVYGCDQIESIPLLSNYDNFFKINLLEYKKVKQLLNAFTPEVIIHCAALTDVEGCELNPKIARVNNYEVTRFLAEQAKTLKAKLIYISTDSVFDGTKKQPYTEDDLPNPTNAYSETKYLGEQAVKENLNNYIILRTNIFGWNIQPKTSLTEWVLKSLQDNQKIKMFTDVYFTPLYITNLAYIIRELIEKDIYGLYHAAANTPVSKYDFGILLAKIFNLPEQLIQKIPLEAFHFNAKRPRNMALNNSRLRGMITEKMLEVSDGLLWYKNEVGEYGG